MNKNGSPFDTDAIFQSGVEVADVPALDLQGQDEPSIGVWSVSDGARNN